MSKMEFIPMALFLTFIFLPSSLGYAPTSSTPLSHLPPIGQIADSAQYTALEEKSNIPVSQLEMELTSVIDNGTINSDNSWSTIGCYGRYCGIQSRCGHGDDYRNNQLGRPVDRFDAACFLHDICYSCANGDQCCPDINYHPLKLECDIVFLHRIKNDSLCDAHAAAGCKVTRLAAIAAFELIIAGRDILDDTNFTAGDPSATNNPNATCNTFSCPYTGESVCFLPCGPDHCNGVCGQECPVGWTCDLYVHSCFPESLNYDLTSTARAEGQLSEDNAGVSQCTFQNSLFFLVMVLLGAFVLC